MACDFALNSRAKYNILRLLVVTANLWTYRVLLRHGVGFPRLRNMWGVSFCGLDGGLLCYISIIWPSALTWSSASNPRSVHNLLRLVPIIESLWTCRVFLNSGVWSSCLHNRRGFFFCGYTWGLLCCICVIKPHAMVWSVALSSHASRNAWCLVLEVAALWTRVLLSHGDWISTPTQRAWLLPLQVRSRPVVLHLSLLASCIGLKFCPKLPCIM